VDDIAFLKEKFACANSISMCNTEVTPQPRRRRDAWKYTIALTG
jgi:hypothetical protein